MKIWHGVLAAIVALAAIIYINPTLRAEAYNIIYISRCYSPTSYKIGSIDPRFGLSTNNAQQDINQAISIWSTAYGKQLFREDPQGSLTVNFVFDERQALDRSINSMESQLMQKNSDLNAQILAYRQDVIAFKQKLADFRETVQRYNGEGGAPPDVYKQLVSQQNALASEADALNERARNLQLATQDYNVNVGALNQNIDTFNSAILQKPEEGLYDGKENTISIYFVDDKSELIHTLAHEFGHALTLNHVGNKKSIMYVNSSNSLTPTKEDIAELQYACRKFFLPQLWLIELRQLISDRYTASK